MIRFLTLLFLISMIFQTAFAKDFPVRARLFAGNTTADMEPVNDIIVPQGLKKASGPNHYGIEIAPIMFSYLDLGIRYSKRSAISYEEPDDNTNSYSSRLIQDSIQAVARIPLLKGANYRFDIFGGYGGANTKWQVKSATNSGTLTSEAEKGGYSSPFSSYGASLAFGANQYFFVMEAGVETNTVKSFKSEGSIGGTIEELNLGGPFVSVGLLLDGIPGFTK